MGKIIVDENFSKIKNGEIIIEAIQEDDIEIKKKKLISEYSLKMKKIIEEEEEEEEVEEKIKYKSLYIIYINEEDMIEKIKKLIKLFEKISEEYQIIVIIEGLEKKLKSIERKAYEERLKTPKKSKENGTENNARKEKIEKERELLENLIIKYEVEYNIRIKETKNYKETIEYIKGVNEVFSGLPNKKKDSIYDLTKNKVKSDKKELWRRQLMEIPSISENISNCIIKKYPTFSSLNRIYNDKKVDEDLKKTLLSDLKYNDRKIGNNISLKIFQFFGE
jgi:hypothetical protein